MILVDIEEVKKKLEVLLPDYKVTIDYVLDNLPKSQAITVDWLNDYIDVLQYKEGITARDIMILEDAIYKWEREYERTSE